MAKVYGILITLVLLLTVIVVALWALLMQPIQEPEYVPEKVLVNNATQH